MADKKKLGNVYRSVVPAPPVEEPTPSPAVVPSAPVAAPAPTPTAALPPAPTVKTPVAPRPAVRKPVAPKPLTIDLKRTPTTEQVLRAATPKPIIAPAEAERITTEAKAKAEEKARKEAEMVRDLEKAPTVYGRETAEVISGDYYEESKGKLKKLYGAMPVIIREAQAKGQVLTPEQVRREAARRSMFYTPVASSLLGKRASVGTIASTLGAIPEAVSAVTQAGGNIGKSQDEMINEQLVDLQKREDFVRERDRKAADPLTDRLVKEMDATYKKFKGKTASAIPAKLVTDFRRKYVNEYMVQNGYDQLTNEQERKAREEEGRRKADEALDNLRAIKNPVVSAGLGAVTKDTVRAAAQEGFVPFVKEVGSVLLPQQAVTASGAAVRTESIPMTILRDIDIPNAVVSGFIPLPGEGRRYRGDPFLRVQRGQTFLPDVLENQWFRESIDGRNGAGAGAAAAGLLAAAAAFEIAMPGLEVAAAPAVAKSAQLAGKMTDKALDVADAIKVARNGLMTTPSGDILIKDLPSVVERTVETVRRTREVLNTTKDTRAFMGDLASAHLERAEGFTPSLVNLEIDASNPAMARVYRDRFLKNVGEDKNLNEVLDILKKDAQERNAPFIEFDALSQNDASDINLALGDIEQRTADAIDDIKTQRVAARAEVDRLARTPSTPDVETSKNAALKKFRELSSDLSAIERKAKRLDALSEYTTNDIARSLFGSSRRAVESMTGSRFVADVGDVDVATRAVPSDVAVDIEDVRSAFGGALVSTEEAKRMASYADVTEFIKNKSSKTATDAEKRLAEQIVGALEDTDAAILVDRLAQAGVRDPFDILRAVNKVDAEVEAARLGGLEDDYDKLVRKQIEAEVEVNNIVAENIQAEDAALQLERTLEQLKEADRIAKQTAGDLKRARSIKVPKAAVDAIRAERIGSRVPAPSLDATSPAAVRAASSDEIANTTVPAILTDPSSSVGPVVDAARLADLVRTALREKVSNKTIQRLIELRHGTDRTMPYAVTGEPWNRPDYFMLPRPSSEGMPPTSQAHSLKLHKDRTFDNNTKYVMQDGDAQRKRLAAVLKQFEAEGDPRAEELRAYLETGSAQNDVAKAQFAQRMGIPEIKDYTTLAEMFDKGGLDAVYKKFDEIAAANPDVPRARGENVYYRWLLNRSAPDGMEPGVVRMDDYVEIRNVDLGKKAGLIPQHVLLPDGSVTFMSGGFVGDRFMGRVVGAVERDGQSFAVVNVYQYGPNLYDRAFSMTGKTIEVPASEMVLFERGRTPHVRFGTKGGKYPELRPMLEAEWSDMFAREDAAFGGLKGKLAYDEAKNAYVYNDLNPPKRPTETDFDFFTEADLLDAVDRQIPLPRMEMVEGGADVERSTLVPAMEQAADVLEERPTEKVGVLGRPPAEPKPKAAAAPLTTRDRRVARMKDAAVNAALNRRDDALELLEQARKANAETRAKASKVNTDRLEALDNRINKIEAKKAEVKANIDRQRQISSAAADIERLSTDTIANVLETRKAMTQRLIDAERASKDILAQERVIAKQAGEVERKPVSLDQEVKEEIRRIAAGEGGVSEFIRGVRRLGSSARETVEGTLSADLRQVIRRIDRNRAEAEQIIRDGLAAQGNVASPREALVVVLQKMNDSKYGDAWASATASGTLNKRAVNGVAFAYINDIKKLTDDEVAGLRKIVVENTGDLNELSQQLYNYSFDIRKNRERAVGDIQMAQSVATQTIIDKTLADAFGLGAVFNREDALAVNAWMSGETGRNAVRGRQLILSVMASAVDTGVPIRGIDNMMNDPTARKILVAADATGAEIAADASAGSAFAASMDAFNEVYAGSAFLPEPVTVELKKVMNDMIGSTRTRNSHGFSVLYKKEVVYGVVTPRTTFYFNNTIQDADGLAVAEGVASKESRRAMVAGALNMVLALPGVSIATGLVDAIRNVRAGTSAEIVARGIANVENWIGLSAYGTQSIDVINRSGAVIDGVGLSGQEMWRIGSEAGVGNTIQSSDIVRTLEQQFDTSLATWRKTIFTKQTDEIGALITERKRWGAFISVAQRMIDEAGGYAVLGRAGVEAKVREAARITTEALMDYSANLHPIERNWFFNIVAPFWSFEKSNMIRVGRLMTTDSARLSTMYAVARSGYKFGVWTRKKEVLAEIASFFLENRDDYGFDVEAMKKDDEARPESKKLYPMYEQAIEQAKTSGLEPATVRGFGAYMTDDRLEVFNPFLEYNIPNAPLYMEPDQFSEYRAPFAIIVGDAKLQSLAMYNDYLDPKNKFGDQDMFTYIQPPDDANLFALHRAVAGANLMAMAAKGMLDIPQEKVAQSVSTNLVDLVGNPLGFNPLIQAVGEVVMQSYDKENAVSIAPMRVSDNVGKMLKAVGLATLENKVVDVDMQQTEFGSTKVKVEPGYYVPKHTAVALRSFLPGMVSIMGTVSNFEEAIEIGSNLVTEQDERRRKEFINRYKKLIVGMSSKSISVQQVDARAGQQIVGDVARYGMGAGTRLKTPLTPEQIRSEALQRAEVKQPSEAEIDEKRRYVYVAAAAQPGLIKEGDLRMIALKDGFATEEELKTLSRYDLIDRIATSVPARKFVREEITRYLSEQTSNDRKKMIDNAVDRVGRNIGDGRNFAIIRSVLQERGVDTDSMTNNQIVVIARKMRAQ